MGFSEDGGTVHVTITLSGYVFYVDSMVDVDAQDYTDEPLNVVDPRPDSSSITSRPRAEDEGATNTIEFDLPMNNWDGIHAMVAPALYSGQEPPGPSKRDFNLRAGASPPACLFARREGTRDATSPGYPESSVVDRFCQARQCACILTGAPARTDWQWDLRQGGPESPGIEEEP